MKSAWGRVKPVWPSFLLFSGDLCWVPTRYGPLRNSVTPIVVLALEMDQWQRMAELVCWGCTIPV